MSEVTLAPDGQRTLREARNLCYRTNVAIVSSDHLVACALTVRNDAGVTGLPAIAAIQSAIVMSQGQRSEQIAENVMFGSAAPEAINSIAWTVREAGGTRITVAPMPIDPTGMRAESTDARLGGRRRHELRRDSRRQPRSKA